MIVGVQQIMNGKTLGKHWEKSQFSAIPGKQRINAKSLQNGNIRPLFGENTGQSSQIDSPRRENISVPRAPTAGRGDAKTRASVKPGFHPETWPVRGGWSS